MTRGRTRSVAVDVGLEIAVRRAERRSTAPAPTPGRPVALPDRRDVTERQHDVTDRHDPSVPSGPSPWTADTGASRA